MPRPVLLSLLLVVLAIVAGLAWVAGGVLRQEAAPPAAQLPSPNRPVAGQLIEAPVREPVADVAFNDVEGREHRLSDFHGTPVLVNFWATWCPPCVAEMPELDSLQARLGTDTFRLLALSQDRGGIDIAKKWLDDAGLAHIEAFHADHAAARALGTMSQLPVSILIDKEGREVARVFGAIHWDTPEMAARITALAAE